MKLTNRFGCSVWIPLLAGLLCNEARSSFDSLEVLT